jgi:hypothetical protein
MEHLPDHSNLQRLLTLKRHETPPPGYFDQFPAIVIGRIRAGERTGENSFLVIFSGPGWVRRLFGLLEARSALAGAAGVAVCGVLIAGLFHSESTSDATVGLMQVAPPPGSVQPFATSFETASSTVATNPLALTAPTESLFREYDRLRATQPVLIDFKPGQ